MYYIHDIYKIHKKIYFILFRTFMIFMIKIYFTIFRTFAKSMRKIYYQNINNKFLNSLTKLKNCDK